MSRKSCSQTCGLLLALFLLPHTRYQSHSFLLSPVPMQNDVNVRLFRKHKGNADFLSMLRKPGTRALFSQKANDRAGRSSSVPSDEEIDYFENLHTELVSPDEDEEDDPMDWVPDRVKAKIKLMENRMPAEAVKKQQQKRKRPKAKERNNINDATIPVESNKIPSPYTEEEEKVIASMGGKETSGRRRREIGYLGDSTLREIAMDYSMPVSYLADVLCMWGVLPPIDIDSVPLGDMVTGEQAFAILEAVNSLDAGALNDRYSNTSLRQLCFEYDIKLQDGFSMAMKEGWSLPFGVETCLRVEQEYELLRVLRHEGSPRTMEKLDRDDDDDEYQYGQLD